MKQYFLTFITVFVAVLLAVFVSGLVGNQSAVGASGTRFPNGISADTTSPSAGQVRGTTLTITGATTIGTSGTAINKYKCYSDATFNPGSISSTTAAATLAFLTPSVTAGDVMLASLASVTSTNQWFVTAKVTAGSGTAGATTTLYMRSLEGSAIDLSTTTAKVCIIN